MSVRIKQLKYVAVRTGYTARLVRHIETIKRTIREQEGCADPILYINDTLWGPGMIPISPNQAEITRVRELLPRDASDGVIVLQCSNVGDAFRRVRILTQFNHCAYFNMEALYQMDYVHGEILVLYFDCESG